MNKLIFTESVYKCITCDSEWIGFGDMKKHLVEIHKLDLAKDAATKTMLSHFDERDSYTSNYQYKFDDGTEILSSVTGKRDKDDPMRLGKA